MARMSWLCFILPSGLARIRGKCSGKAPATVNVQKLGSSAAFISQMQALNEQKKPPISNRWAYSNLHIFPPGKSHSNESRTFALESLCVFKTIVPPHRLYFYLESVLPPHLRNQAQFDLVAWSVETTLLAVRWLQFPFIEYTPWRRNILSPSVLMLLHRWTSIVWRSRIQHRWTNTKPPFHQTASPLN